MKNLVIASSLLAAGLAAGCGGSTASGPSDCDDLELDGGACVSVDVVCPEGATEYTVSGLNGDVTGSCTADVTTAVLVDAGSYTVVVTPYAGSTRFLSESAEITVGDTDWEILTFSTWAQDGFMELTWTVNDAEPTPAVCSGLSAGGVSALATIADESGEAYEDVYNCEDGYGLSSPMPLADYVVVVALLNENDESIADSLEQNVSLQYNAQVEDLGNINFVTQ